MMSGKDLLNSHFLSWPRKVYSDWEDATSSGRVFQVFGPATGKAWLPTVDRLTGGTRRRLVPVERSDRLPGRLRTAISGPRYGGAIVMLLISVIGYWHHNVVCPSVRLSVCPSVLLTDIFDRVDTRSVATLNSNTFTISCVLFVSFAIQMAPNSLVYCL